MDSTIIEFEQNCSRTGQLDRDRNQQAGRRILIAEGDLPLASFLRDELQAESFKVDMVHDGEAALSTLRDGRRYDLLLTGLDLPGLDGISLLQRVKPIKPRLSIMVLTARSRVEDKVMALHCGADDCLVKPFSFVELVARIRALLRRNADPIENRYKVADLTLHPEERKVERNGRRIELTPREYSILEYMMRNAGRPVSRATLFEEVWNAPHDPSTNIVDVYMKYVRDKVDLPGEHKLTHTIRGIGYELREA